MKANWRLLAKLALMVWTIQQAMPLTVHAQAVTREAVLRALARDVIATGYQDMEDKGRALTNAASRFAQSPDQASLDQTRQAWTAMAGAANRLRCFQAGPIVDREYAAAFYYSRISPPAIDGQIQSSNVIDLVHVTEMTSDLKGVFGLEYLLFGHKGHPGMAAPNAPLPLSMLSGDDARRRRAFLLAMTRDLESKAGQLAQDWTLSGEQGAAAKFVAGGQASFNLVVNKMAQSIEDLQQNRLCFVLLLPNPLSTQLYRIESSPSGASLLNLVACLEGARRMYRGQAGLGLRDSLKEVNPSLAKRVEDQFDSAISAAKAIAEPLDQAAADKRAEVQKACDQVRALEILIKVDLASALGVTITFTSGDGD